MLSAMYIGANNPSEETNIRMHNLYKELPLDKTTLTLIVENVDQSQSFALLLTVEQFGNMVDTITKYISKATEEEKLRTDPIDIMISE